MAYFTSGMGGFGHAQHAGAMGPWHACRSPRRRSSPSRGTTGDSRSKSSSRPKRSRACRTGGCFVGDHRELVEAVAGQARPQALRSAASIAARRGRRHVEREQVLELPIDGIEIPAMGVGWGCVCAPCGWAMPAVISGMVPPYSGQPLARDALDIGRHGLGGRGP